MKTISRILIVAAVVASLASIVAFARDFPNAPPRTPGTLYTKAYIWRGVPDRVTPMPKLPGGGERGIVKQAGPVSVGASARLGDRVSPLPGGSAIPSMGGGDFMSPMERTDQQIKRLIKRLG